ncbi:Uncharacterized protein ALO41_01710 [Pseudomonas amygdali pv. ulmi]|uniref:FAD/FMN-containing dehydrogenase n=1 Tax=Pseudomonas amygdali pv. ulmi TaxID=251720 RepID=A0A0Q0CUV9_PSEA0|nr:Uncharacterized protein ALO41_01710 [Pseudomonas amygdali pv. ulmi]KWS18908.1 hypothetical protein AL065_24460 [Pseudomonas amygdali pv. ulmi]RMR25971.1 hypothetical protein ALP90_01158 [Pseudomonas amygdali pv. ulmi]
MQVCRLAIHFLIACEKCPQALLLSRIFRNKPKGFLESCHTVFAIPQMRDYRYCVMLDREARIVPQYAGDDDKGLWLQLRDGQLVSQQQFGSADALRTALEKPRP